MGAGSLCQVSNRLKFINFTPCSSLKCMHIIWTLTPRCMLLIGGVFSTSKLLIAAILVLSMYMYGNFIHRFVLLFILKPVLNAELRNMI